MKLKLTRRKLQGRSWALRRQGLRFSVSGNRPPFASSARDPGVHREQKRMRRQSGRAARLSTVRALDGGAESHRPFPNPQPGEGREFQKKQQRPQSLKKMFKLKKQQHQIAPVKLMSYATS